ncbi:MULTISPECIES: SMP-30/gluconolactonase/LRE family protein [unclassified Modicisalibacter]|uniref:SMP-30/gluconolactonase/LRE family protein n=1 Tax=unclassified Modicisalibacter TaxID=2679913 RepID=UPI001CC9F984|nr:MULTISPECIES: SMP-30/gluconolactonase/LRE family protein [unclassified Modicisalibacter]MBZ9559710.1 SMP-30/gluconolactonase/LRE family protein [Modicisalibacter sp. R2A 31.J]MBZ9577162.1 SMP-30/gluconolactonase/LRE family protein [Modicisalibacter sp. MOD 31.J]
MKGLSIALASQAELGESPVWSSHRGCLLWVDTLGASLNVFDPATGQNVTHAMPSPLGFVTETHEGQWLVGIGCHVERFDERSGNRQRIATAPHAKKGYRLNDACLDPAGRLWVGLMDENLSEDSGYLYRLDPDGIWHIIDSGFTLINGLAWSLDGKTLYVTDSRRGTIYAYEYDALSGEAGRRRKLVDIAPDEGKPDGLVVDQTGCLLSVLFDGASIARISPDGDIVQRIRLPVPRPTSCTFDGRHRHLFVTSARLGLSRATLANMPASGAVLKIDYQRMLSP